MFYIVDSQLHGAQQRGIADQGGGAENMPILKIKNDSYDGENALENVVNYVLQSDRYGGLAVDPEHAVFQMRLVKQLWSKTDGRQVRHMILSFSKDEVLANYEAMEYGYQICQYFGDRFQIVFALHTDTDHVHLHFVLNTVSFVDGIKFSAGLSDYWRLRNYIQSIMPQWHVELVQDNS